MAKIVIFDSDARVAAAIKTALASFGHEGIVSNDGYSILPLAEQHKPALFILDYKIPEADGFEILQRLRKTKGFEAAPVIFASATPKFEIEMVVLDAPAVAYVDKPLDAKQLREAVESFLAPAAAAVPAEAPDDRPAPAAASFTGEADLDGSRDGVIDLD
ncbi:MAG: response regulator [Elusimicrobiota bacterium]|nr:MAG: response regulator [Elusimicrobiota bacterium]